MADAEQELERRSKFLNSLIQKKKSNEQQQHHQLLNVKVRASDMPIALQNKAFQCARDLLDSMPTKKLDSKRLALAIKKVTSLFLDLNFLLSYNYVLNAGFLQFLGL